MTHISFDWFLISGVFKNLLRMQVFRTLGRLTFGAYLIHPSVIRLSYGSMRHPFFTDDYRLVRMRPLKMLYCSNHWLINDRLFQQFDRTLSAFVTSYLLSFFVVMTIELPFSTIQKLLFNRNDRKEEKTIYETTETEAIKLSKKIAESEAKIIKPFH